MPAIVGPTWTTDAPFRETDEAIAAAKQRGILAVEMEAAALYTFAAANRRRVLCLAHVTNTMGQTHQDFERAKPTAPPMRSASSKRSSRRASVTVSVARMSRARAGQHQD